MSLVDAPGSTTGDFHSAAWLRFQALTAAADTLVAASDDAHLACTAVAALLVAPFRYCWYSSCWSCKRRRTSSPSESDCFLRCKRRHPSASHCWYSWYSSCKRRRTSCLPRGTCSPCSAVWPVILLAVFAWFLTVPHVLAVGL